MLPTNSSQMHLPLIYAHEEQSQSRSLLPDCSSVSACSGVASSPWGEIYYEDI
jgi:hypothetical protein